VSDFANLARARSLLDRSPVIDGHNDLAWEMREQFGYDLDAVDLHGPAPSTHTDLARLAAGGVGGQFWSVYVPSTLHGESAVTATLEQVDFVRRMVERYPDRLALAGTAAEVERAMAAGRVASLLGAEGGHSMACSMGTLRSLYALGVRYMTLTHNDNVPWADSATDEPAAGGLTPYGRAVVREMNRLGMLVDLSHVAATTMRDALDAAVAPMIFSHSSCRELVDHPRNVPDDVLARLPEHGGVCMVTFVPAFVSAACWAWEQDLRQDMTSRGLDWRDSADHRAAAAERQATCPRPEATLAQVADHVEHVREVAGVDAVGLGGDYDGTQFLPVGLADVSCYPALVAELLDRGWSEAECEQLTSRNVLRAMRAAETVAADMASVPPSAAQIGDLDG
jgi:membrane dipeptidase